MGRLNATRSQVDVPLTAMMNLIVNRVQNRPDSAVAHWAKALSPTAIPDLLLTTTVQTPESRMGGLPLIALIIDAWQGGGGQLPQFI